MQFCVRWCNLVLSWVIHALLFSFVKCQNWKKIFNLDTMSSPCNRLCNLVLRKRFIKKFVSLHHINQCVFVCLFVFSTLCWIVLGLSKFPWSKMITYIPELLNKILGIPFKLICCFCSGKYYLKNMISRQFGNTRIL